MSAIEQFIKSPSKSMKYYLKLLWSNIGYSEEIRDNSWKTLKIASTYTPKGYTKDGAFKYLNEQWNGRITKAYND